MTPTPYRILFFGTPAFAVPTLTALFAHGERIVGVVTQPDRPKGRGLVLAPSPVKELALGRGVPVFQPVKLKDPALHAELAALKPDLAVVVAYGRILPAAVINIPTLGTINVHGSILPRLRGAAPIQWAIIRGEVETGITIMQMDEGLDTGDMLLIEKIPITDTDTAGTLAEKLAQVGANALCAALDRLRAGTLPPKKQDDALATLAPPLKKEDGIIDWSQPASTISCLMRGLDPWPGTTTSLGGKRARLFSPKVVVHEVRETPGTIVRTGADGLLIATGQHYLLIGEVQLEGSRRMPLETFLRGHAIPIGLRLP